MGAVGRAEILTIARTVLNAARDTGSVTWDPPSVASGSQTTTTVTVAGAVMGRAVMVGFSQPLQGMQITGSVDAPNVVTVVLHNGTGGAIDLASGTLTAHVWSA